MKIGLNPEHYQYTKGKRSPSVPPGIVEYEFNMSVVMCLSSLFQDAGHDVVRTMEMGAKVNKSLTERRRILSDCDLSITIAANASDEPGWSSAKGFVVFHKAIGESLAVSIARAYQDAIPEIKPRHGGIIRKAWGVLPWSVPGVLIECGFMTNRSEAGFLSKSENQQRIARAIYGGSQNYIDRKNG